MNSCLVTSGNNDAVSDAVSDADNEDVNNLSGNIWQLFIHIVVKFVGGNT